MAQPSIPGTDVGRPVMPYGNDGSAWIALLVSALGRLQVDVITAALGSGGATAANQSTMITALQLIDDLRAALASVATDQLRADVISSALPTGAATSAKQNTMITALQLIDDLRNALGSVNTDDLQVDVKTYPGSNALGNIPFGYYDTYHEEVTATQTDAGNLVLDGSLVPSGEVWVVTSICLYHNDTTSRRMAAGVVAAGTNHLVLRSAAIAAYTAERWAGHLVLEYGDGIRGTVFALGTTFAGSLYINGYKMKVA